MRKGILVKKLVAVAGMVFLLSSNVWAILCVADTDCDGKVNLSDLVRMKEEFLATNCDPCIPAPVPVTGFAFTMRTGDDYYYATRGVGVQTIYPQFEDLGNTTVRDLFTGLIWEKDADSHGDLNWASAVDTCHNLGMRLPNVREFLSIFDYNCSPIAIWDPSGFCCGEPGGCIFENLRDYYWTSTPYKYNFVEEAWYVHLANGKASTQNKAIEMDVWCVSGP